MVIKYKNGQVVCGNLQNGDLLFRWLPMGLPRNTQLCECGYGVIKKIGRGQRQKYVGKNLHKSIEKRQRKVFNGEREYLSNIQHVGIYYNDHVIEVGGKKGKVLFNKVVERENYDVVLRSPLFSSSISKICERLVRNKLLPMKQGIMYAKGDIEYISNNPLPTRGILDEKIIHYIETDEKNFREEEHEKYAEYKTSQAVICSHFVLALLYMAIYKYGSIRIATTHKYDDYFKISVERLYRQYKTDEKNSIMARYRFVMVGLQHHNIIIPYRALYVAGWSSDEFLINDVAKLNIIRIFHNELNKYDSNIVRKGQSNYVENVSEVRELPKRP